ncbi:DUF192 domain-containing protein [Betaproteobacteria bacterium PRO7]|jgi:uncharacterized membrane protein (UPF0127 family)|nr:DUF192 domain-containing protein [Betaproteobacteria bacterium PRO7]
MEFAALRKRLAAFALALACIAPASAQGPQPALPTIKLSAGIHLITAEVASSDPSRMRGLMFRESLAPNHGMLFVFDHKAIHCMWMRNTLIPLSVAFVDDDGAIVNIEDMAPRTETSHCARRPVRFALEMEKGWFARRGIAPGARLGGLPGSR